MITGGWRCCVNSNAATTRVCRCPLPHMSSTATTGSEFLFKLPIEHQFVKLHSRGGIVYTWLMNPS